MGNCYNKMDTSGYWMCKKCNKYNSLNLHDCEKCKYSIRCLQWHDNNHRLYCDGLLIKHGSYVIYDKGIVPESGHILPCLLHKRNGVDELKKWIIRENWSTHSL